jgi:hypothetical protein
MPAYLKMLSPSSWHASCAAQYVSEAVAAIAESTIKTKDIGAAVQVTRASAEVVPFHMHATQ